MRDTYVRVMGLENRQGFTAFVSSDRALVVDGGQGRNQAPATRIFSRNTQVRGV